MPYVLRRGLGDGVPLNCPGDPGCPGYIDPNVNNAIQAALQNLPGGLPTMYPGGSGGIQTMTPFSFTSWLNQNAGTVAIGGALLLFLMMAKR